MPLVMRILTALLVFAFVGGSQACLALCSMPASPKNVPANKTPEKACHHCGMPGAKMAANNGEDSKLPAGPCKHCENASFDRVMAERSATVDAPAITLAVLPAVVAHLGEMGCRRVLQNQDSPAGPPNERLHVVCVLLI